MKSPASNIITFAFGATRLAFAAAAGPAAFPPITIIFFCGVWYITRAVSLYLPPNIKNLELRFFLANNCSSNRIYISFLSSIPLFPPPSLLSAILIFWRRPILSVIIQYPLSYREFYVLELCHQFQFLMQE